MTTVCERCCWLWPNNETLTILSSCRTLRLLLWNREIYRLPIFSSRHRKNRVLPPVQASFYQLCNPPDLSTFVYRVRERERERKRYVCASCVRERENDRTAAARISHTTNPFFASVGIGTSLKSPNVDPVRVHARIVVSELCSFPIFSFLNCSSLLLKMLYQSVVDTVHGTGTLLEWTAKGRRRSLPHFLLLCRNNQ